MNQTKLNSNPFRLGIVLAVFIFTTIASSNRGNAQNKYGLYVGTGLQTLNLDHEGGSYQSISSVSQLGAFRHLKNNWQVEAGVYFGIHDLKTKSAFSHGVVNKTLFGGQVGLRKLFVFDRFFVSSLNRISVLGGHDNQTETNPNTGLYNYKSNTDMEEYSFSWTVSPGLNLTGNGKHRLMLDIPIAQYMFQTVRQRDTFSPQTFQNSSFSAFDFNVLAFTYLFKF